MCTAGQTLDITALMRRHRRHSRPRHRTHRQGKRPRWGVRFSAVALRVIRTTMDGAHRFSTHPEYRRVIRGAFLAPWFAVSLGIVIAASLTLAAPHAALTFPATKGGQCDSAGCPATRHDSVKEGSRGSLRTEGKRAARLRTSDTRWRPDRLTRRAGHQVAGARVRYRLLPEQSGHFMAMIVISGQRSLGPWALEFALPGARISLIMWAKWALEKPDSVIIDGIPSPWPRSSPDQVRIVILGTGMPRRPADCVLNDARCAFTPLSTRRPRPWLPRVNNSVG